MSSITTHQKKSGNHDNPANHGSDKIPNLRFPGFEGEWMATKLEELCNKISDGIHATPVYDDTGEYYFVNGNNLVDGKIEIDDNTKRVSGEEYVKHKRDIDDRTILMSINGTIGNLACYGNEKVILGKSACYINVTKQVEKAFIYNTLQLRSIKYFFNSELTGTTIKNLSLKTIKNTNVNIPSLPEQQKIASFLTVVDQKIQHLTRKKELLEQYKKGVMQKIFSQEIRFKPDNADFDSAQPAGEVQEVEQNRVVERSRNYPDWEEKRLGDMILEYRLGGNYTNSETVTPYPLIKMGNLGRGNINLNKLEYISEGKQIDIKDKIQYGDLFFNTRNTLELVGKVSIWRNELPTAYYNSNLMLLKFENNFFMNYRLNSHKGIKGLRRFATGTTSVAAIYTRDLLKLKLSVPCIEEQEKIANFIMGIDQKNERIINLINQTQQFKKGLLQQMFV